MAATCTGLGGALARPICEPRLVAASTKPGATQREVQGSLRLAAACLNLKHKQKQAIPIEKSLETAWVG